MNYRSVLAALVAAVSMIGAAQALDIRQGTVGGQEFLSIERNGVNSMLIDVDPVATSGAGVLGRGEVCKVAQVTITSANQGQQMLFAVPASAQPTHARFFYAASDNAASSATFTVGYATADGMAGTEFLNAVNVKSPTPTVNTAGIISTVNASSKFFTSNSLTTFTRVTGTLAETGTASTSGGPFVFELCYYTP